MARGGPNLPPSGLLSTRWSLFAKPGPPGIVGVPRAAREGPLAAEVGIAASCDVVDEEDYD